MLKKWIQQRALLLSWARPGRSSRTKCFGVVMVMLAGFLSSVSFAMAADTSAQISTEALPSQEPPAQVDATAWDHAAWNQLLKTHVVVLREGQATEVNYQALATQRADLKSYLHRLGQVNAVTFDSWGKAEQLAFLINAYNAWTVELILTQYPDLASIKDLGSWFSSPWSKPFIPLLGESRSLDDIEHKLIRGSGRYNEPRIHFAVNCASIGCPALRAEAYTATKLDAQLADQTSKFMMDRSRNRPTNDGLVLSAIFKWYRDDFEQGWNGIDQLETFLVGQATALGLSAEEVVQLQRGKLPLQYDDYDWRLNDIAD